MPVTMRHQKLIAECLLRKYYLTMAVTLYMYNELVKEFLS